MQFNVGERLHLMSLLIPAKGSAATVRIIIDLKLEIGLSDEELTKINLREKDGLSFWDEGKVPPKQVSIGSAGLDVILSVFKRLDQMEEMTAELYPLYEKLLRAKHETTPKLHEAGVPGA